MKYFRKTCKWPSLFAVSALCMMLVFASGCSKFGKKETAEFKQGDAWLTDMRGRVEENIEDADKKTRMLDLVDRTEQDVMEIDRIVKKLYTDISILGENYDASPEAFREILTEFEADRIEIRDRIIDTRFAMRDLATPEEWGRLTDNSKKKGLYQQTIGQPGE